MPLTKGELVAIACLRDLSEGSANDLSRLRNQLYKEKEIDDDVDDISMAAFYINLSNDYIDKILDRHEKMKKFSTDLVPVKEITVDPSPPKDITEMSVEEIGEGTVLFDPQGEAWVVSLWTKNVMDLKQGNITKANVKPENLKGWSFDGNNWGERIEDLVYQIQEENENCTPGRIIAEIVKKENCAGYPIQVIKTVNRVLSAA